AAEPRGASGNRRPPARRPRGSLWRGCRVYSAQVRGEILLQHAVVRVELATYAGEEREAAVEAARDVLGRHVPRLVEERDAAMLGREIGEVEHEVVPAVDLGRQRAQRDHRAVERRGEQRRSVLVQPEGDRRHVAAEAGASVVLLAEQLVGERDGAELRRRERPRAVREAALSGERTETAALLDRVAAAAHERVADQRL